MDLLSPDSGVIFWTVLTFIILLMILKKYAWKPILQTLEERETKLRQALSQAEQDQKKAEKLLEEQKALLETARRESSNIINESQKSAENSRKEIMEQAQIEADRILERAKQEINLSKEAAISEVRQYAIELSFTAAQKIIGETLSRKQHIHLIKNYIKELSQSK